MMGNQNRAKKTTTAQELAMIIKTRRELDELMEKMRPYYTIEKSPRNRKLDSEEEKAKNKYLFHTICGRDDRCRMNIPIIDVPK
jgi:hypothetical protein